MGTPARAGSARSQGRLYYARPLVSPPAHTSFLTRTRRPLVLCHAWIAAPRRRPDGRTSPYRILARPLRRRLASQHFRCDGPLQRTATSVAGIRSVARVACPPRRPANRTPEHWQPGQLICKPLQGHPASRREHCSQGANPDERPRQFALNCGGCSPSATPARSPVRPTVEAPVKRQNRSSFCERQSPYDCAFTRRLWSTRATQSRTRPGISRSRARPTVQLILGDNRDASRRAAGGGRAITPTV
jgi:hypothetical protein